MRAEKGQKWKKPLKISKKHFFLNRSQIFIALPKFYVTHRIYEILSKSLVPTVQSHSASKAGRQGWISETTKYVYKEYHKECPLVGIGTPQIPLSPASVPLPHRARIPSPLPLRVAKTGRNHLNEEFTPPPPTGIGERFYPNLINLGYAAPLRRCELPL